MTGTRNKWKKLKLASNMTTNINNQHSHANMSVLNSITPTMVNSYHFHTNITTLNGINSTVTKFTESGGRLYWDGNEIAFTSDIP